MYYPLEAVTNQDDCQPLPTEHSGTAVDNRYDASSELSVLPNEYEVQKVSGVYDTLTGMPSYYTYVPEPRELKSTLYYDMWTRTTLDFEVGCSYGEVSDAVSVLQDMEDADGDSGAMNLITFIIAIVSAFYQFVYQFSNTYCVCSSKWRGRICFKISNLIYHIIAWIFTAAVFGCCCGNFIITFPKFDSIVQWSYYGNCVDSYMAITG